MFEENKEKQKLLTSFEFEPGKVEKGYTDRRLHINLSENKIEEKSIDLQVKETFTGGRGYGIWYLRTWLWYMVFVGHCFLKYKME